MIFSFEFTDDEVLAVESVRGMDAGEYLNGVLCGAVNESVVLYKQDLRAELKAKVDALPDAEVADLRATVDAKMAAQTEPVKELKEG